MIDHIDIKTTKEKKIVFKKKMNKEAKTMSGELKRLVEKEHKIEL